MEQSGQTGFADSGELNAEYATTVAKSQLSRVGLARKEKFGRRVRTVAHVLFRNIKPAYFKYWYTHLLVARWAGEL